MDLFTQDDIAVLKDSKDNLVAIIAKIIGKKILRGEVWEGALLPWESEICSRLEVSRNTVREALKLLEGKNMIQTFHRSGTIVLPDDNRNFLDAHIISWSLEEDELRGNYLKDLLIMRRINEPEACALAAKNASTKEVLIIHEFFEGMEEALRKGIKENYLSNDIQFHHAIYKATHNKILLGFLFSVTKILNFIFDVTFHTDPKREESLSLHKKIVEAILSKNSEKARTSCIKLLDRNESHLFQEILKINKESLNDK